MASGPEDSGSPTSSELGRTGRSSRRAQRPRPRTQHSAGLSIWHPLTSASHSDTHALPPPLPGNLTAIPTQPWETHRQPRPPQSPSQDDSASPSTSIDAREVRVSFRQRGRGRGSQEPPQTRSSAHAVATAAGLARLRSKERSRGRECSPPRTASRAFCLSFHASLLQKCGARQKVTCAGFHSGWKQNKLQIKHPISRAMCFRT